MSSRRNFLSLLGKGAAVLGLATISPTLVLPVEKVFAQSPGGYDVKITPPATAVPLQEGVGIEPLDVVVYTGTQTLVNKTHTVPLGVTNIRWLASPPSNPTMHDPLGQFGFVSQKFTYQNEHYGAWVRYDTNLYEQSPEATIAIAKQALMQRMCETVDAVDKKRYALAKLQRISSGDTMRVQHINQFVDYLQGVAS